MNIECSIPSRHFESMTAHFIKACKVQGCSALDIGIMPYKDGAGHRKPLSDIGVVHYEAIEIYKPYVEKLRFAGLPVQEGNVLTLHKLYEPDSFDIVLWNHGPEHLNNWKEIKIAVEQIALVARNWIIIGFPIGKDPVGEYNGNPYTAHKVVINDAWRIGNLLSSWGNPCVFTYKRKQKRSAKMAYPCADGGIVVCQKVGN